MSVRDVFRDHGVSSVERAAEYVAFLLLIHQDWNHIRALRGGDLQNALVERFRVLSEQYGSLTIPQPPPVAQWGNETLADLLDQLQNSIHETSFWDYFQRNLRWEMLKETSGAQYPTPYHIANMMASLGVTLPNASVLDPAMGSAGLLVAALSVAPNVTLTGSDFDPIWAGMGSANLILHNKETARVFVGSALAKFEDWQNQFDTVLMNPPFGGSRGAGEAAETVGAEYGRNNATVMGAFALKTTRPGGRAVFLTPSGTLFTGRGAEANLKASILAEALEAIITLPKRAFYPFSNVEAHLIVVRKRTEDEVSPSRPVWFCQVEADGYPEGAERDLTAPTNATINELPRVQALIVNNRQPETWQTQVNLDGIGAIQTTPLSPPNGLPGIGVRVDGLQSTPNWEILAMAGSSLLKIYDQQAHLMAWLSVSYPVGEVTSATREHINARIWTQILPRADWAGDITEQWVNETVESTLTVQSGDQAHFILEQGRTNYRFEPAGDRPEIACLLDENGQPQTPWLHIVEPKKIHEEEFGERYAAIPLQDAEETLIGWLLEYKQDLVDADHPRISRLLIVFRDQVNLFDRNVAGFGFAYRGYFQVNFEGRVFRLEQGQVLPQQISLASIGFAIGPEAGTDQGQRLFAMLLGRTSFAPGDDLRPCRFLPEPEAAPIQHPTSVLANIRKNQTKFDNRVNRLLSILGDASKQVTQNNQAYPIPEWIIGMLDVQQKKLWQAIADHQVNNSSAHFNLKDLLSWKNEINGISFSDADTLMQLELFTRMGLIMKVHSQGENLYRCLIYQDVLKPQTENPEGNHEAA
ncbi:MAG: hypothetical protein CVU42_00165 [Chloroflexi bacterium HGW-Chloroflexi-4]|jgi:hypothetical protein|nr:MAG: hypothetical protein CVU42_00165 [Chloroflexi bacterium HGW-Chloroflexi-4]